MPLTDLLAFRRSAADRPKDFGHRVRAVKLPRQGRVEFAEWQHPERPSWLLTQAMVDEVRQFVAPGDLVIDVGARTGASTLPMALAAGPRGLTLALEPHPAKYAILARNATLNRDQATIEALEFAATRESRRILLRPAGGTAEVAGRNLNYVLKTRYPEWLSRFRYLQLSTGRYDRKVLETLVPTLSERRPVIRCTVAAQQSPADRERLYDLLVSLGYDPLLLDGESWRRMSRQQITTPSGCTLTALPRAVKLRRAA